MPDKSAIPPVHQTLFVPCVPVCSTLHLLMFFVVLSLCLSHTNDLWIVINCFLSCFDLFFFQTALISILLTLKVPSQPGAYSQHPLKVSTLSTFHTQSFVYSRGRIPLKISILTSQWRTVRSLLILRDTPSYVQLYYGTIHLTDVLHDSS